METTLSEASALNGCTLRHNGTDSDLLGNLDMEIGDAESNLGDLLNSLDMEPGDAESDVSVTDRNTGMLHKEISSRLQETFGSVFSRSRTDEVDSICHMVYGQQDLQTQEAILQMIHDSKVILIDSQSLPRSLARLLWPCGICGSSGHSTECCPAYGSAAAAMHDLEQAKVPAGSASTKVTAGKQAQKRAKQAAKRAKAENATTATNGNSGTAAKELGKAAAKGGAAPDAASVVDSAYDRTADADIQTQQPELGVTPGRSSGADGKQKGDADSEQGVSRPADSTLAARPGSAGAQDNHHDHHHHQQQQQQQIFMVPSWESALAHLSLQQPAQLNDGVDDVDSQPGSFGGDRAGSAWAVPAERGDGPASIGMPPRPLQHHDMPPREAAAGGGPEEEDDLLDLLSYLGADRA